MTGCADVLVAFDSGVLEEKRGPVGGRRVDDISGHIGKHIMTVCRQRRSAATVKAAHSIVCSIFEEAE